MTTYSPPLDDSVVTQISVCTEAVNLAKAIQAGLDVVNAVPDPMVNTLGEGKGWYQGKVAV